MNYNAEKLDQLHIDQHKGALFLREICSALRFAIDHRREINAALASHPVTIDRRGFRLRGIEFSDELIKEHAALTAAAQKAEQEVERLQAQHDRLEAEQQRRGELLQSCLAFLEAKGVKPELTDVRAGYVGSLPSGRIVVGSRY